MEDDRFIEYSEPCSSSNSALGYEFWTQKPESVNQRRSRFLKWMGLSSDWRNTDEDEPTDRAKFISESDAELAHLDSDVTFFSSGSLSNDEDGSSGENLDDKTEFKVDEISQDGMLKRLRELGSSPMIQRFLRRDSENYTTKKEVKKGWLGKLRGVRCNSINSNGVHKLHVHSSKKQSKELSSLFNGQDFPAHEGSILTMKFSHDGHYLATAGNDGIVRVWKVFEAEISNQDIDPSSVYVFLNDFTKLPSMDVQKEKISVIKRLTKSYSRKSPCVILPSNVFRILEKPVHEFHGHSGEVLALSWSKNGYLLSSSIDKTARLWQIGTGQCLGIYKHNNYVTCIEFNPVDDNLFISGSIDGKVRIWEVHKCRVIDWIDIREIVSAVCFCPQGKGGIVGSMDGNCRFYDIIDNRLELGAQISLPGKKLSGKRIIGFEFCPSDASKVLVTSADSQVRIICDSKIICKFKGVGNSGSQGGAKFTRDGKHIISGREDSNIYIWNYINEGREKKNIRARESFSSHNALIAIPWCGLKSEMEIGNILENEQHYNNLLYKGTSTWPEEKLVQNSNSPCVCKSEFKYLKSALQSAFSNPHMWGNVIVTAGWDGCIRTFLNYGLPIRF